MDERRLLYGYDLDEVEEVAAELFQTIAEAQVPVTFAILALCRTITMIGTEEDLDLACIMIDQLRELSMDNHDFGDIEEEVDEEGDF